jgi:hypothetical protein
MPHGDGARSCLTDHAPAGGIRLQDEAWLALAVSSAAHL